MIENPIPWPEGKRCAVAISFDVDAETLLHLNFRDSAPGRVALSSLLRYDMQVAVPRLLEIFRISKRIAPDIPTKTGMILGLGETNEEVVEVMKELRSVDVDILTLGQYLQPSRKHLPIERYWAPEEFAEFRKLGYEMGFKWVESGPLVRSSFRADFQARALSRRWRALQAAPARV